MQIYEENHSYTKDQLVFTARHYAHARSFCCRPVSVRPSVWYIRVLYPEGWIYCQTSFSAP